MMAVERGQDFQAKLEGLVEIAQNVVNQHRNERGYARMPYPIIAYVEPKRNTRYVKLTTNNGTQTSVYCFVDSRNGDVLKAATWKTPAKHARSNIYDEDGGRSGINEYGANYL